MRILVFLHRWLGAALAAVLTVWFLSGMVMMYWGYPSVTTEDRLRRAPTLSGGRMKLSVEQAFSGRARPARVFVTSFDGRPIYVGDRTLIYADDGSEQRVVDRGMVDRAAAAWSGRPLGEATIESITRPDQWTLEGNMRLLLPLLKYSWPDGQQVYAQEATADIVQYTTRESRFWAYLGPIPHWLYLPILRSYGSEWFSFMVWSSLAGTVAAVVGLVIAIRRYSPQKRYRYNGVPARIPYQGWKRWHTVAGLLVGFLATTWTFSGMLSLEPFRLEDRLTDLFLPRSTSEDRTTARAVAKIGEALLDGWIDVSAFAAKPPAAAIASIPDFDVKELEFVSLSGKPVYVATNGQGATRIVPVHGDPMHTFDAHDLSRRVRDAAGSKADVETITAYDLYYRDRTGALPLPAIRVRMNDRMGSRYYIDPQTAMMVGSYSQREWVNRWLFQGLHSMDFPWLYNHRPLWDIVVLTLLLGGTALCVTSLVLTWRVIARMAIRAGANLSLPDDSAALTERLPVGEGQATEAVRAG